VIAFLLKLFQMPEDIVPGRIISVVFPEFPDVFQ
jgi:hypothetical protein